MKMAVFWVVAPCSLVEVYQRFRGPCCLDARGLLIALLMEAARTYETLVSRLHGATTQKTAIEEQFNTADDLKNKFSNRSIVVIVSVRE
jgi:hypothetical protein